MVEQEELMQFEGKPITKVEVVLPRETVEAEQAFAQGDLMNLSVELRVGGVQFKDNGDGTLTRVHHLKWEHLEVLKAYDPTTEALGGSVEIPDPEEVIAEEKSEEESDDDELFRLAAEGLPSNVTAFPAAANE